MQIFKPVLNPPEARNRARRGLIAALVVATGNLFLLLLNLLKTRADIPLIPSQSTMSGCLNVAFFVIVAWRIHRLSYWWSFSGLVYFLFFKILGIIGPGVTTALRELQLLYFPVSLLIAWSFIESMRSIEYLEEFEEERRGRTSAPL